MMPEPPSFPIEPGLPSLPPLPMDGPFRGVKFNAPPAHIFRDAMDELDIATASLKAGEAAIVGVSTDAGWNAAVVGKTAFGLEVFFWIGAEWGQKINKGAMVRKKFTLPF